MFEIELMYYVKKVLIDSIYDTVLLSDVFFSDCCFRNLWFFCNVNPLKYSGFCDVESFDCESFKYSSIHEVFLFRI